MSKILRTTDVDKAAKLLKEGQIGVLPTDSVYGIMADAFNIEAVNSVFKIKDRPNNKPLIILLSKVSDMLKFGVSPNDIAKAKSYWPGKTSLVFRVKKGFEYINNGSDTLAFRIPDYEMIQKVLVITGPLVAPSANPSNLSPATDVKQAIDYFKDKVDFYLDDGVKNSMPSRIIDLTTSKDKVIRE